MYNYQKQGVQQVEIQHTVIIVTDETVFSWLSFRTAEEAEADARKWAEGQQLKNPVFVTKPGHIKF